MTRKHFEAVAEAILAEKTLAEVSSRGAGLDRVKGVERIASNLANVFAQTNDRFDRARFMTACGF